MNKFQITLEIGGGWVHETKEDEKDLVKINACLSLDRCVKIGDTIYTRESVVKIKKI